MGSKENYSRNQCTLLIRIDDQALEIPVNFGLTAQEIRTIYPYLAKLANTKIPNPALQFADESKNGKYDDLNEAEYSQLVEKMHGQSEYWYQKPEASLLDLAIRLALDIQFKGIPEIQDAFATVTPFERIKTETTVSKEEAAKILKETGMESETDLEFDAGDENDVEKGIAGDVPVDIYGTGDAGEFLSKELDEMDSARMEDRFENIINGKADLPDRYKSNYKAGGFKDGQIGEDGLLDLYATDGSTDAIFGDEPDDGSTADEVLGSDDVEDVSEYDDESEDYDPLDEPVNEPEVYDYDDLNDDPEE